MIFQGLENMPDVSISSNFLKLEKGGAFHHGDFVVEELMNLVGTHL